MKAVVITGVASGIGHATARLAIEQGIHVFGSVRQDGDAARLVAEFGDRLTPLRFDVRDEAALARAASTVGEALNGEHLFGLVNNAGIGLAGPVLHQPLDEFQAVMDTNLLGPLLVTRAFASLLGAGSAARARGRKGRIVNISSIAGKVGQPFAGAYVASKHALEGLSDVMRRELALYGIRVVIVAPATVDTPIWDEPESAIGRYDGTDYGDPFNEAVRAIVEVGHSQGLAPKRVAEAVLHALTTRRPRIRYSPARHPVLEQLLPRITPDRVTDVVIEKTLGLKPKGRGRA
ncbi:SDR family NAD(P)-dependent oxidoreductase [Microvirga lotononidis]|uniref:Short-chain alcohol dehydrogenase n=1 Tax=Microvirga lotononidis TaxID=864069 RepID=I4Z0I8_9HYPH|nr:SDR family NAD(P)-dependent oxidoreductase [Microvirga lotononidis]EIM29730.1 short-chain alcohol dehydrogenase [Microvirga lotononidis]WQO26968.1 SDR family NAD(P)-dependent oxidoreductase [Microvirga lotononidis]